MGKQKQTVINFIVLCPIFLAVSLLISSSRDAHLQDFAAYWQAGHMILTGQNVYDSTQWEAVREVDGTAFHSEPTFQYPLPFAVLFSVLARLPVQFSYTLWIFLAQIAILSSIAILLSFYPTRSRYLDVLTVAGIFLFRPTVSVIGGGQILPYFLLFLSVSIFLFHDGRGFSGGLILSMLSLKPSIGFPILILGGVWLVIQKQWRGILGMTLGGLALVLIGMIVNYHWIIDYISIGGDSFHKYYGQQPTMWGILDKIFKIDNLSLAIGFVCATAVLTVEVYLFWRGGSRLGSLRAFATILPAALFIAPYSWNYDQILLAIPIVYLLMNISRRYGLGRAALFMFGVVALAIGLVAIAYSVGHDVWSFLNPFVIWMFSLYFVNKSGQEGVLTDDGHQLM